MQLIAPPAPLSLGGLRLGMTPDDVRSRFSPGLGSFRSDATGPDPALVWEAPGIAPARFEFHDGQLVAVWLVVGEASDDARGPSLETTPGAVLARTPRPDGEVSAVLLSRTCPTHRLEAERIAAGGSPN